MSRQWTAVNAQPKQERTANHPKSKDKNDNYKFKRYNDIKKIWGHRGVNLTKQYLICHPERLDGGRTLDETPDSEWPALLPFSWTCKLSQIARRVESFEDGLRYIRYQIFKWYGQRSSASLFPGLFILDKVVEMIEHKTPIIDITEKQLAERGLKIGQLGLFELYDGGFNLRGHFPIARRSDKLCYDAASSCRGVESGDIFQAAARILEGAAENLGSPYNKSSQARSSDVRLEYNGGLEDTTHSRSHRGIHSLNDLHPEIIEMIATHLSIKDRMSMSLTSRLFRHGVRKLLRQDLIALAASKGDIFKIWGFLREGVSISWDITEASYLDHPLLRAAAGAHLQVVQIFLYELEKKTHDEVSPEQRNKLEAASFVIASGTDAIEIVEYFVHNRNIDVNCVFDNGTALANAAAQGQDRIVSLLLEAGARATCDELESAYRGGFADVVSVLLLNDNNKYLLRSYSLEQLHELIGLLEGEIEGTREEMRRTIQESPWAQEFESGLSSGIYFSGNGSR